MLASPNGHTEGGSAGGRDTARDKLRDKAIAAWSLLDRGKPRAAKFVIDALLEELAAPEDEEAGAAICGT